jgi:type II secretory pathway pseudopilin PulG
VELLIVISIFSILLSFLSPVMKKIVAQGDALQTHHRFNNSYGVLNIYSEDHDDQILEANSDRYAKLLGWPKEMNWWQVLTEHENQNYNQLKGVYLGDEESYSTFNVVELLDYHDIEEGAKNLYSIARNDRIGYEYRPMIKKSQNHRGARTFMELERPSRTFLMGDAKLQSNGEFFFARLSSKDSPTSGVSYGPDYLDYKRHVYFGDGHLKVLDDYDIPKDFNDTSLDGVLFWSGFQQLQPE